MQEINKKKQRALFRRRLRWVVPVGVVAALLALIVAWLFAPEAYVSECTMYARAVTTEGTGSTANRVYSLSTAREMAEECVVLLKTDKVLEEASHQLDRLGYAMSAEQLRRGMQVATKDGTALLTIRISTSDPNLAKAACDMTMNALTQYARTAMPNQGSVTTWDEALVGVRHHRGLPVVALWGLAAGMVLAVVGAWLQTLKDTITDEEALKGRLPLPVLGSVPDFRSETPAGKGGRNHG